jgi:hypothetical protein
VSGFPLLVPFRAGKRPSPVKQASLPPPDPSDSGGNVWTVFPPEQVPPPHFTDPTWLRADFAGTTIPGDWSPRDTASIKAQGGCTIVDGRWAGLRIPYVAGANTTPPTMLMTPQLVLYPPDVRAAFFTEQAERDYDDFIYDSTPWGSDAALTDDMHRAWVAEIQSWGFRAVLWRGDPNWTAPVDDTLVTALNAGITAYVHGEEADRKVASEPYTAGLQALDAYVAGRIPIFLHFTCGGDPPDRPLGYPIGMPRETFLNSWQPYDGRVHLALQLNGTGASAGTQGAAMWYARLHVNAGEGEAAHGPGAPNSRVVIFELPATQELYGAWTELDGCKKQLQVLCGTRTNPVCRPVNGFANGGRQWDGTSI